MVARALGSVAVLMLRAAPTTIERAWVAVWVVGDVLSEPLMVKLYVPAVDGVPLMAPAEIAQARRQGARIEQPTCKGQCRRCRRGPGSTRSRQLRSGGW